VELEVLVIMHLEAQEAALDKQVQPILVVEVVVELHLIVLVVLVDQE
jgi:hypothetical protein